MNYAISELSHRPTSQLAVRRLKQEYVSLSHSHAVSFCGTLGNSGCKYSALNGTFGSGLVLSLTELQGNIPDPALATLVLNFGVVVPSMSDYDWSSA